jgi:hypothetical protein
LFEEDQKGSLARYKELNILRSNLKNIEPPRDVFSEILGLSDSVRCPFDEHSACWFSAEDTSLSKIMKNYQIFRLASATCLSTKSKQVSGQVFLRDKFQTGKQNMV